jgi:hypothetical protein
MLYVLSRSIGGGRAFGPADGLGDRLLGRALRGRGVPDLALVEALNPKMALFFLTFLPQFCQPQNGPVALRRATGAALIGLGADAATGR